MCNLDLDLLFPKQSKTPKEKHTKKPYDIKITLNKSGKKEGSGDKRQCMRFAVLNNAAEEARKHPFIEVSDIEYLRDRIYFRFHDAKTDLTIHTLSTSSHKKDGQHGFYFTITPTEKGDKLYRMNWVGKGYKFQYDSKYEMFYISNDKEGIIYETC